ncbi:MAG: phytanoyl-CoA dioxygenase family protein [Rhodospirillales bacterium]|nr:phytanoyl-CoA dioxygenase family protein [Rhodospirillales bacterium]MDP6643045.1 phytanoyl-CoA dioxygenase family protein [Rhodospirillales bacterium]
MSLSEAQIAEFRRKGFIVVKGFFGSEEMARISKWLSDMAESEGGGEAKFFEASETTGDGILVRVEDLFGGNNPEFTELLISPEVRACLAELFGEEPVLFKEKINYKLPGCRADKLHQDQAAGWNRYCDFFITMAVAVDENRQDNAALSFMSSGNYERGLMTPEWETMSEDDPPYAPADEYALLEADPGDVIFFDCYVPHGSPPNTGQRSRRNIFLTFNRLSDGDMRAQYYADKAESYPANDAASARAADSYRV